MQPTPATATQFRVQRVFDVRENVKAGVRHLRYRMDRYQGNLSLALAAYNAGRSAVARYRGVPLYAETRAYVARILSLLQQNGVPGSASAIAAPALYRDEGRDGRVVYPIERLSWTTRPILEGRD